MFQLPEKVESFFELAKIVKSNNLYPIGKLIIFFNKSKKNNLNKADIDQIKKDFHSDEYGFDEVYKIKLAVVNVLLKIEELSDAIVLEIDPSSNQLMRLQKGNIHALEEIKSSQNIQRTRLLLKKYGESLKPQVIKEVKDRLALLEIFTRILPNDLIPDLITICPRYLGCPIIQKWISQNQYNSKYGDEKQTIMSEDLLRKASKALLPDKRQLSKRTTYYWGLDKYYHNLTDYIKHYRNSYSEEKFDKEEFEIFCDVWKIPTIYEDHFISNEMGPKELALEIMESLNMVASARAFREFQPKINMYKKKHEGVKMMGIINNFLDCSISAPRLIDNPQLWELLD